jgi:TonB family protein
MKKLTLLLTLSLFHFSVYSQSDDIKAKSAFLAAQDAYGNGDYATSVQKLEYVKELLGSTNPRVEHLLANGYLEIGQYDKAQQSLSTYFELAADSDANYLQMILMVELIEEKRALSVFDVAITKLLAMDEEALRTQRSQVLESLPEYDVPAKFVEFAPPNYPSKALKMGLTAKVFVFILVDESGKSIRIVQLNEHPDFAAAILKAVQSSTFSPAIKNDQKVKGWILQPYSFGAPK